MAVNTERSDAAGPLGRPILESYFYVMGRFFMPRRRTMKNPFPQNADNPGQNSCEHWSKLISPPPVNVDFLRADISTLLLTPRTQH